ncbi:MAG: glycosyltransferase family 4 protein [Rhodothermales bacterium]
MNRVCVHWPRFGPYHLARLEAAHGLFAEQGVELIGLETAGRDATYAWRVEDGPTSFRREQVFPDQTFEAIPPSEMHDGVTRTLDQLRPDAVAITSYSFPDARASLVWCRRARRTAVLMSASREEDALRVRWREHFKSLLVRQYDAALVGGRAHRAYLERLGFPPSRIFLGYNAVDNDYFCRRAEAVRAGTSASRHLPGLDDENPFFLAVGRFTARKNLDGLLEAYNRYRARTSEQGAEPWRLVLLGDGPERSGLEKLIEGKKIGGVTLAGFRQIEETSAYYGRAAAFVHPAQADQWALVVNEAMAAGLPVLVSTGSGCAEDLVRDGENGYRFDPHAPDVLAEHLNRFATSADLARMGQRSQEIIAAWSPRRFAEGLWEAVQAGRPHADRPLNPAVGAALWALRKTARSADAFHTVEA